MRIISLAVAGALAAAQSASAIEQFVAAVQKVRPSVVTVVCTCEKRIASVTTGVVVSPDGLILTARPQSNCSDISVRSGGTAYAGTIHGSDAIHGLALIKINANDLVPAEFADSNELQVGQWVMSVGNQFGVERNSSPGFSVGIIGGLGCCVPLCETHYRDLIKTDAAMNPGCVGGPLVDFAGRIVGINIAIWSSTGDWQGVGYAIPSNAVAASLEQMKAGRKIERGWLGIAIGPGDTVKISSVGKNTPAEKAGLREGDVVISWNGTKITDPLQLVDAIVATEPGSKTSIVIERDSKPQQFTIEVGTRPEILTIQGMLDGEKPEQKTCELPENIKKELVATAAKFQKALQHGLSQIKDPAQLNRFMQSLENLPGLELKVLSSSTIDNLAEENSKLKKELDELKEELKKQLKEQNK